jgi:hypothetical protein
LLRPFRARIGDGDPVPRALPWAVILRPVGAEDAGAIHIHSDSVMTRNARKG